MKHAAALVIVAIVAGSPVSGVACVGLCAPDGACPRVFAISPFVKEEIQLTTRAAMPAGAPYVSVHIALGEAQPVFARDVASAVLYRPVAARVLRL